MKPGATFRAFVAAAAFVVATTARADYYSHPELRPENRCVDDQGRRFDPASADSEGNTPAGLDTIHCQKLFWDLPLTGEVGAVRVGAPYAEDAVPRFVRGVTDRPPPMYICGTNADGEADDCDGDGEPDGYENDGPGRVRLCSDPDQIPYWEALVEEDGSPQIGTDTNGFTGVDENGNPTGAPQEGPLFRVTCERGSRAYFGPWQTGTDSNKYDELTAGQMLRFENTDRLNRDVAEGRTTEDKRFEWSIRSEFYNHFSSHHGTCWSANPAGGFAQCNDPENTLPREAFQPGGDCYEWQKHGNEPDPENRPYEGGCYSADVNQEVCTSGVGNGGFRNATQIPGRLSIQMASEARGVAEVEDQIWNCNHHVVTQLPPGSYGMTKLANYRLQKGGLVNTSYAICRDGEGVRYLATTPAGCGEDELVNDGTLYGVAQGGVLGGAVGEMLMQNLTAHATSGVKPLNIMFNAIGDAATTMYPPFTWNYHTALWFPPFDSAVTITSIHSHHRMVKGTMDILPANPLRLNSPDPLCGGSRDTTAQHIYENWDWEDARVCQYWQDPDGPVIVRKHEAIATTCFVNNGVTPEAIKHGLVAGDAVETLKVLGAPIPEYPEMVPASTWGDAFAESPVGQQLLYGTHPPINYRVVYKCARDVDGTTVVGSSKVQTLVNRHKICDANPAVDADGDYIDGPYANEEQCGVGGVCEPGGIVFACVGEEEMCIGVAVYYALPRLGDMEGGHEEAMENLQAGEPDKVGLPGNTGVNMDMSGICPECETGL